MECFRHDVPEEELSELKILLSKVLDPDLSPLGLQPKEMYVFISERFENTTAPVMEQALYWLQVSAVLQCCIAALVKNRCAFFIFAKNHTNKTSLCIFWQI